MNCKKVATPTSRLIGDGNTPEDQFWSRVSEPDATGCMVWEGGRCDGGYGRISYKKKQRRAHSVAYELAHSTLIPEGFFVCHRCDNRPCVNPTHLYLGTARQNAQDRENRNRGNQPKGENHPNAKLSESQVRGIKRQLKKGRKQVEIAREFAISRESISAISTGKTWSHVLLTEDLKLC